MEIPNYYSFEEFGKKYSADIKYLMNRYNCSERFVLSSLNDKLYKDFLHHTPTFRLKEKKHEIFVETNFSLHDTAEIFRRTFSNYLLRLYKSSRRAYFEKKMAYKINWGNFCEVGDSGFERIIFSELTDYEFQKLKELYFHYTNAQENFKFVGLSEIFFRDYSYLDDGRIRFRAEKFMNNEYGEKHKIAEWINKRYNDLTQDNSAPPKNLKPKLSNPKKLALLYELGIFDLPKMKNLSDDRQNEILAMLLDADKTEFVYKNRLNLNSKNPNYQIEKYGAYKYLDEMKKLISDI